MNTMAIAAIDAAAWFDTSTAGTVGGLLGAAFGVVFGGVGGTAAGVLAPRGKAKAFVVGLFVATAVFGLACVIAMLVAWLDGQPRHVLWAFLLPGVMGLIMPPSLLPMVLQRYREADNRRAEAAAIRGV